MYAEEPKRAQIADQAARVVVVYQSWQVLEASTPLVVGAAAVQWPPRLPPPRTLPPLPAHSLALPPAAAQEATAISGSLLLGVVFRSRA